MEPEKTSGRRDPVNFVLWRITPGQSGGWAEGERFKGKETVNDRAEYGGVAVSQRTRKGPRGEDEAQVSSGEATRPRGLMWKCLSCRMGVPHKVELD